ncbi:hypothetical protein C8F01DRAFT_175282 [Mycena amicta]|nr:hypothetical protein C8F01DRAFT_175282 [Mycena amicta]
MMSLAALAQELVDTILDFLHSDHHSLLQVSLVARKWVPATRYHLFERVMLSLVRHRGSLGGTYDTARPFLDLCRSPLCTILPSIQEVSIAVEVERAPNEPGIIEELIELLGSSPVRKMHFLDLNHAISTSRPLAWIAPRLPHLQDFTYNSTTHFVPDALSLVTAFPELCRLALYSRSSHAATRRIFYPPYPTLPGAAPFRHLTTLRVRFLSEEVDRLMAWLLTLGDDIHLETLDIVLFFEYHSGWGPVDNLNAFFKTQGHSLRTLMMQVQYDEIEEEIGELARVSNVSKGNLDLSPFTHLETLYLNLHHVSALLAAVASVTSTSLTSLETAFKEWPYWDDAPCGCDGSEVVEFSDLMARDGFKQLTSFIVRVPSFFGPRGLEALYGYFPQWDKETTDVLQLLFVDDDRYPEGAMERDDVRDMMFGIHRLRL